MNSGFFYSHPISFRGNGSWGVSSTSSSFPEVKEGSGINVEVGGDAASCFF